jgi:transposase
VSSQGELISAFLPLLKEKLYGFTQEEIFGKLGRASIREIEKEGVLGFQVNQLLDKLERDEADIEMLKNKILVQAEPFMPHIEILTSMKGISVFIAIAIIRRGTSSLRDSAEGSRTSSA